MSSCLQCGKCCLGLDWTFTYEAPNEDENNPSKEILDKASKQMASYGLLFHEFKSAEKKDGYLSMTFNVGICQHLGFHDEKAFCKNHDKRPVACKSYFCEKSKTETKN